MLSCLHFLMNVNFLSPSTLSDKTTSSCRHSKEYYTVTQGMYVLPYYYLPRIYLHIRNLHSCLEFIFSNANTEPCRLFFLSYHPSHSIFLTTRGTFIFCFQHSVIFDRHPIIHGFHAFTRLHIANPPPPPFLTLSPQFRSITQHYK